MDEETQDQALTGDTAPSESPPEETEHLEKEGEDLEDADSDDGDTVDTADEDEEPQHDDEDEKRGNVPYSRFKAVNEAKKAALAALTKAGLQYDEATGEVVPIEPEREDWDVEPEASEEDEPPEREAPAPQAQPPPETVKFAKAVASATLEQIIEWAEENGYGEWSEARALEYKVQNSEYLQRAEQRERETAAREAQAGEWITKALTDVKASDPYLSVCPEAVSDLKSVILEARKAGVPRARIAEQFDSIRNAAIVKHLPAILKAHGSQAVASETERRKVLTSQSPSTPTAPAPAGPKVTAEMERTAKVFGNDAKRVAAEVARIRSEK